VKICIECKSCVKDNGIMKCNRPIGDSVITGKTEYLSRLCVYERHENFCQSFISNACGKRGRYWRKK
jgi:hypothetical protein